MWNSYWSGRARREVPQVNYNESSEEEDFNSPLVSPSRPPPTRAGSPALLAVPTLGDNVDEELAAVSQTLNNVGHTHTFRGTRPHTDRPDPEGGELSGAGDALGEEEVVEGQVVGVAGHSKVGDGNGDDDSDNNMPDNGRGGGGGGAPPPNPPAGPPVNFDVEDTENGEKASENARHIKVEFDRNNIKFWFVQLEDEMMMAGRNRQWVKRSVLQRNLPLKQKEDVMALLLLQQAEAGADIYFRLKSELLRIYAAKPKDSYCKALTRTMVGLPSQLGYQIVNDVCKKPVKLVGCCCPAAVEALWQIQLPVNIRAHISNMEFNHNTYKQVFESADQVYLSARQVSVAALQVAAVNLDETQPAFLDQNQPQVAAFNKKPQNQSGGQGKNKGGKKNNKGQKGQGQGEAKPRGPRHSSNPPDACCDRHYRHGAGAWYCLAPSTCPWKDKTTSKNA